MTIVEGFDLGRAHSHCAEIRALLARYENLFKHFGLAVLTHAATCRHTKPAEVEAIQRLMNDVGPDCGSSEPTVNGMGDYTLLGLELEPGKLRDRLCRRCGSNDFRAVKFESEEAAPLNSSPILYAAKNTSQTTLPLVICLGCGRLAQWL